MGLISMLTFPKNINTDLKKSANIAAFNDVYKVLHY